MAAPIRESLRLSVRDGAAFLLHERTCPYPEVARHKAAACVVDVAFVGALTRMDVRLSECQVRGDACCTYRLAPLDGA